MPYAPNLQVAAAASIVKAIMGAGDFSLPWAVAQGGACILHTRCILAGVFASLAVPDCSLLGRTLWFRLTLDSGRIPPLLRSSGCHL